MKPYSIIGPSGDLIQAEGVLAAILDGDKIGVHAEGPWGVQDLVSAISTLIMFVEKRVQGKYPGLDLAGHILADVAAMKTGAKSVSLKQIPTEKGKDLKPSDIIGPEDDRPGHRWFHCPGCRRNMVEKDLFGGDCRFCGSEVEPTPSESHQGHPAGPITYTDSPWYKCPDSDLHIRPKDLGPGRTCPLCNEPALQVDGEPDLTQEGVCIYEPPEETGIRRGMEGLIAEMIPQETVRSICENCEEGYTIEELEAASRRCPFCGENPYRKKGI